MSYHKYNFELYFTISEVHLSICKNEDVFDMKDTLFID